MYPPPPPPPAFLKQTHTKKKQTKNTVKTANKQNAMECVHMLINI